MSIVLITEGNTDATLSSWDERKGSTKILLLKLLESYFKRPVSETEITVQRLPRRHDARGYTGKVTFACDLFNDDDDVDAIAIVIDRDGQAGRRKLLEEGREFAKSKNTPIALNTALGVAKEMLEAWLLADTQALSSVFGVSGAQSDPESMANPKARFSKLIENSDLTISQAYDKVALQIDITTLRKRCGSFDEFASEVQHNICTQN